MGYQTSYFSGRSYCFTHFPAYKTVHTVLCAVIPNPKFIFKDRLTIFFSETKLLVNFIKKTISIKKSIKICTKKAKVNATSLTLTTKLTAITNTPVCIESSLWVNISI